MKIREFLFDGLYYHTPGSERWFSYGPNKPSIEYHKRFAVAVAEGKLQYAASDCICGNDEFDVITTVDRHKIQQMVVLCTNCGLMMNNPRLNEASYNYYYASGIYRSRDRNFFSMAESKTFGGYYKEITDFLNGHDPEIAARNSVLEIGCNTGYTLLKFQQAGWNATGLEPYDVACKICEDKGLNVVCGVIEEFEYDQKFDLIYLTETFEHIYDFEKGLNQIRKLLKDDGRLFIRNIGLFNQGVTDVYKFAQVAHPFNYCLNTLRMVVESNGFELIAGDEFVQGLFKKAEIPEKKYVPELHTAEKVRNRLLRMEADANSISRKYQEKKVTLARYLQKFGLYNSFISAKQLVTGKKNPNIYTDSH